MYSLLSTATSAAVSCGLSRLAAAIWQTVSKFSTSSSFTVFSSPALTPSTRIWCRLKKSYFESPFGSDGRVSSSAFLSVSCCVSRS